MFRDCVKCFVDVDSNEYGPVGWFFVQAIYYVLSDSGEGRGGRVGFPESVLELRGLHEWLDF